jgi:hypothetical protein
LGSDKIFDIYIAYTLGWIESGEVS